MARIARPKKMRSAGSLRLRQGVATLDYVLVLGVVLPLAAFLFKVVPRLIALVYETACVFVAGPFM